jgi:anti-anti-sigma factor
VPLLRRSTDPRRPRREQDVLVPPPPPAAGAGWTVSIVDDGPDEPVVSAAGELDAAAVADLRRLLAVVSAGRPRRIVLDLAGVTFLDAAVLGALVTQRQRLGGQGIRLDLSGVTPSTRRLIELCGLTEMLGID